MNRSFSFSHFYYSHIPCLAAISLIMLVWSIPVFCGEIHDTAQAKPGLEADAFIISGNSNNSTLVLQITNRSETPKTIPTEHYMRGGGGMTTGIGYRITHLSLFWEILIIGTAEQPEELILIPSLSKLAPVTLRKGETAQISMPLDGATVQELKKEDEQPISIQYRIGKKISERFGLWQGTLEIKKSYRSMTANKAAQNAQ
jgi:hypothetical protein